jgi:hypothetical protein
MTMAKGPTPIPLLERVMRNSIPEPNSGCWLWLGVVGSSGYGNIGIGSMRDGSRGMIGAHRAAYIAVHGDPGPFKVVCHKCDVKLCVNPDHLFAATQTENLLDSVRKGRWNGHKRGFAVRPQYFTAPKNEPKLLTDKE